MSSRHEQEDPGPSGVSCKEMLALLRLERPEDGSEEEDALCNDVMDTF